VRPCQKQAICQQFLEKPSLPETKNLCDSKNIFIEMALKPRKKPSNVDHWYTQYRAFRFQMRFLILFTTLMAGWLLMSGIYNGLLIGFGIASCLLCSWLSLRIGATDREGLPTHLFARLPAYLVWLIGEIIGSNIATAKIILRGTSDPEIFEVSANQATAAGLANYANSITLTPGTVTVDIDEAKKGPSRFLVHALHSQFGDDVRSGDMDQRNCALEEAVSGRLGKSGK
jgi:multicomponent Na+:H+ antiporter subunit E